MDQLVNVPSDDVSARTNDLRFPGGIVIIGPEGSLGQTVRKSVVEIKGAFSSIIIPLESGAGHFVDGNWVELYEFDHLTIHPNLQIHLQSKSVKPLELSPSITEDLSTPICLASVSAAPAGLILPATVKHQKYYEGGGAIIAITPDQTYKQATTHLFVDIWTIPLTSWSAILPSKWPGARRLASLGPGQNSFGPIGAPWAFRRGIVPKCMFLLMLWLANVPDAKGPIIY